MEKKSVYNKIYIALNTQMFGNLRKYISPKLIEQKIMKFNYSNNDGRYSKWKKNVYNHVVESK